MRKRSCRVCGTQMQQTVVDLGLVPLCQSYPREQDLDRGEMFYPLHAQVCTRCLYVGLGEYLKPEDIFTEYAYFSSMSDSWLEYAARSAESMIEMFKLDSRSQVVEMASNDGYLLQFFVNRGVPALGVEPAANVAKVANEKGVPTLARFFTAATAAELKAAGKAADLLLAYNCLDHVPDPNDVVSGMKLLLKPHGVVHVEFPDLRSMIDGIKFDTVYHDRYSYFCFHCVRELFSRNGLRVFDVQRISTHGGSLRVRACHEEDMGRLESPAVAQLIEEERHVAWARPSTTGAT